MFEYIHMINWVPTISLLALFISTLNLILFYKILKKVDDDKLQFLEYIENVGRERIEIYKHIDTINKKLKIYGGEVKKQKESSKKR